MSISAIGTEILGGGEFTSLKHPMALRVKPIGRIAVRRIYFEQKVPIRRVQNFYFEPSGRSSCLALISLLQAVRSSFRLMTESSHKTGV